MFDYYHYFVDKGHHPNEDDILKQEDYSFLLMNKNIAFDMINEMITYAQRYNKNIGVRIIFNGEELSSSYNDENVQWLKRKEHTVNMTGHSSYYVFLNNIRTHQYDYMIENEDYAICGGGFPLIINNEIAGTIACTGLRPHEDHDVVIHGINYIKERVK